MSRRILIVEDDPDIAQLLDIRLTMNGFETRKAGNGAEAILLLDEYRPAVIVTDWMMPLLTGVEMAEAVRSRVSSPQPHIIMVSSRSDPADELRARRAGANDYLRKPISFPLLLNLVGAAVQD